jgi:hypothetical protein
MSREFTCTYGNCRETTVPIILTSPMERPRFCCMEHAMMAVIRRAWIEAPRGPKADNLRAVEIMARDIVGDGS